MPVLTLCLLLAATLQTAGTVTNEDILAMVRAGVPESSITAAIGVAARRGDARLDASPSALIALRQAGASEALLNTLIAVQSSGAADSGLPEARRVSMGGVDLSPFLLWQRVHPHSIIPLVGRRSPRVDAHGYPARATTANQQPAFEVRGYRPDAGWQLVQFDHSRGGSVLRLRSKNGSDFLTNAIFDDRDVRPLELTQPGAGGFTLRPAVVLNAGEYALCAQIPAGGWLRACYPFAVAR